MRGRWCTYLPYLRGSWDRPSLLLGTRTTWMKPRVIPIVNHRRRVGVKGCPVDAWKHRHCPVLQHKAEPLLTDDPLVYPYDCLLKAENGRWIAFLFCPGVPLGLVIL